MTDLTEPTPTREDLDKSSGVILVEFGAEHCGYCQAAKGNISQALSESPNISHLKIEDGPGKKLGRTYRVKLWPTLILLQDGREISRVIRPDSFTAVQGLINKV